MATHSQEETHNSKPLHEKKMVWTSYQALQLLRLASKRQASKINFESQWDLHPWDPPRYSKQENILKFSLGFCPLGIIFNLKDKKP